MLTEKKQSSHVHREKIRQMFTKKKELPHAHREQKSAHVHREKIHHMFSYHSRHELEQFQYSVNEIYEICKFDKN